MGLQTGRVVDSNMGIQICIFRIGYVHISTNRLAVRATSEHDFDSFSRVYHKLVSPLPLFKDNEGQRAALIVIATALDATGNHAKTRDSRTEAETKGNLEPDLILLGRFTCSLIKINIYFPLN